MRFAARKRGKDVSGRLFRFAGTEKNSTQMSIWNMYCRKKSYVFLTAVMYAFSMLMISSALPQILTGTNNTAIINGGMGFVLLVLVVYMNYNHISRFKRASKNEEWLKRQVSIYESQKSRS